jgi:hypothetical protein
MTERPRPPLARRLALLGVALASLALLWPTGRARAGASVSVNGSAYVDEWFQSSRTTSKRSPAGVTIEGAVKMGVDVNDDVSFSTKACFSCHGLELESMAFEYMPSTAFNVQAGRLSVPFGEYHTRVDQSGHKTTSAPLIYDMGRMAYGEKGAMNLGVLPMPYVDSGVLIYGQRFFGPIQAWYGLYGVSGLRGGNDMDWTAMRSLYYTDSNRTPAGGGRVSFTYAAGTTGLLRDSTLGASFTGGRYDKDGRLRYLIWGVDAMVGLGPVTLRGEYAYRRTGLSSTAAYVYEVPDPWFRKDGWYLEAEAPLTDRLAGVVRQDQLRRTGVPLPGAAAGLTQDSRIDRTTAGLVYTPATSLFVKLGWEYWSPSGFQRFHSLHLGLGGAF